LISQPDLKYVLKCWSTRHTLSGGAEFGRQLSVNFRNTGLFKNSATTISVPFTAPTITSPITVRQNPTDADNHVTANIAAAYAQDQIKCRKFQVLLGVRFDRFNLRFQNNRNSENLQRIDKLISHRAGMVFKPIAA